ncbi:Hsp70 family protein [Tritonibacter scottomollicae]|uniref:Hsp70 family protein n=1 Tax=Tritonibacter scottomollicae TaxID=483013 RepID=UPI003AA95E01
MSTVIGIDFGTTSSRVSFFHNGIPTVIKDSHGDGTIPSYVALSEGGKFFVGEAARRYATRHPARVAFSTKRLIGLSFNDPTVQEFSKKVPFSIVSGDGGVAWVELGGIKLSPVSIGSLVLHRLRCVAERYLKTPCTQCILTVPADFNELQRLLLVQSALDAGLEVLRTVAEPTAASLTTGAPLENSLTAVYDLGGGTFDVTIMEYDDGLFEVKDSRSDLFLGGEDFDFAISDRLTGEVSDSFGFDVGSNPIIRSRLKTAAENAKIALSFEERTRIELPFLSSKSGKPLHFATSTSRSDIEADISHLVERSLEVCAASLNSAGVATKDIQKVVLVGGSTRIPLVFNRVKEFFGLSPEERVRREDAVVLGAAIQAGVLTGDVKDTVLLDVAGSTLGFGDRSGKFYPVVTKGTTFPTKKSAKIGIPQKNIRGLKIPILEEVGGPKKTYNRLAELLVEAESTEETKYVELTFEIDARHLETEVFTFLQPGKKSGPKWNSREIDISGARSDYKFSYPDHFSVDMEDLIDFGDLRLRRELPQEDKEHSVRTESPSAIPQLFFSYAREDAAWLHTVLTGLGVLERTNRTKFWYDERTEYGNEYRDRIFSEIERSWMCILILSPAFLSSEFVLNEEIPRIFAEHERRGMKILPIMARPCAYALHNDIEKLQSAHDPKEPLAVLSSGRADEILADVAVKISNLLG